MLAWFQQLVFGKFGCIFVVNSLELRYKKLNCFLDGQKSPMYCSTTKISQAESFLQANPPCEAFGIPWRRTGV